jgi:hypothetical protein
MIMPSADNTLKFPNVTNLFLRFVSNSVAMVTFFSNPASGGKLSKTAIEIINSLGILE